ncbi:dihydrofolate reductase-like [Pomacea canaliculata]|nr:dihydrofolate reductase-like [Pomacea canaliculata]
MSEVEVEIVVAILDKNRGFALGKKFPWPYLKGDHEFYINLTTTRTDLSKRNAYIMGRNTWEEWQGNEKQNPALFTVVTSRTLRDDGVPHLQKVLPSLEDAITYVTTSPVREQIEKVFLMGGKQNYDQFIDDPRLKRIYVTRIFGDFEADVVFPVFEHRFKRVSPAPSLDESLQEDNGVQYQFELWEPISS